ncbi:hypothetical protein SAMN06265368_3393 [Cohaesibacter gelatinilyticus]|uniref:Uncharacterized protein n=1 Tax=Cohaesibacter gelatinilyticus TaxID=372072 RepID=A0A285PEY8_9HYPH|nr:hypothetical protein SAMN06265368_3393 [Cohaesibacter gelatinilyticus]
MPTLCRVRYLLYLDQSFEAGELLFEREIIE